MAKRDKVLVLNSGSSSVKFKLFEMSDQPRVIAKGSAERIGQPGFAVKCECGPRWWQELSACGSGGTHPADRYQPFGGDQPDLQSPA